MAAIAQEPITVAVNVILPSPFFVTATGLPVGGIEAMLGLDETQDTPVPVGTFSKY